MLFNINFNLFFFKLSFRILQVCLTELSRTPGPESESSIDRESYSLSAGLALGMITLGQGQEYIILEHLL